MHHICTFVRIQFLVPHVKSQGATGTKEIHLNNQISKFPKQVLDYWTEIANTLLWLQQLVKNQGLCHFLQTCLVLT